MYAIAKYARYERHYRGLSENSNTKIDAYTTGTIVERLDLGYPISTQSHTSICYETIL